MNNSDVDDSVSTSAHDILDRVLTGYQGPVEIRLWNDDRTENDRNTRCTLILHEPGVLRELILHRNLLQLAESYLAGEVDVEGDIEKLFELGKFLKNRALSWQNRCRILVDALRLPSRKQGHDAPALHSWRSMRRNTKQSIAHHYDVGNDFYRLWLDPEMVYSCAYFRDEHQSLADAQRDKLDYLCRKLRLSPGMTLLDIGCGWGALVCRAARDYGVRAHGITLSERQHRHAVERIRSEGLEDRASVELLDYRELPDEARYDRVVSVGMFEHIGIANFPAYFGAVKRALKPGGLFLNHGITNDTGWRKTAATRFMNRFVFPDGELARMSDVTGAMEQAGFEIIDIEGLRRHYALTLRRWFQALESNRTQAIGASDNAVYRSWRLYMAGAAFYFDEGRLNVYQILASHARQSLTIPLRRDDLYS